MDNHPQKPDVEPQQPHEAEPGSSPTPAEIDAICNRFEQQWQSGAAPSISAFIPAWEKSARSQLLQELILVDIEYRRKLGEAIDYDSYYEILPDEDWLRQRMSPDLTLSRASSLEDTHITAAEHSSVRFDVLHSHARGGLGEVYVAKDRELGRQVALKEIQPRFAADQECRARFLMEARVTGNLEHPGIIPIYSLGQHKDGRPYYAMRFVRGENLAEATARFHRAEDSPASTDEANPSLVHRDYESVEFRKLLGHFIDVCNALEYAHSQGILHRDLKPANIMLGAYGETLVVDWGLAKLADKDGGEEIATAVRANKEDQPLATHQGAALGTPAYMPPEQASGNLAELGPASDIYALGATLYFLLVGKPPVGGTSLEEVLENVKQGRIRPPRTIVASVPKQLQAICNKALSKRPADRYVSCRALADDIERYLAGDPVEAFLGPLSLRLRRWGRRHRTLVTSAASVLLVSLVGLIIATAVVSQKNRSLTALTISLNNSNQALVTANEQERIAKEQAEQNAQVAEAQSNLALATLTSVVGDFQESLANTSGGAAIRRRLLNTAITHLSQIAQEYVEKTTYDLRTAHALIELGEVVERFGADSSLANEDKKSSMTLASAFYNRAHEIAITAAEEQPDDWNVIKVQSVVHQKIGNAALVQGNVEEAYPALLESLSLMEQIPREQWDGSNYKRNETIVRLHIGKALLAMGRLADAEDEFNRALEAALEIDDVGDESSKAHHSVAMALEAIGDIHLTNHRWEQALTTFNEMRRRLELVLEFDRLDAEARRHLALAIDKIGDTHRRMDDFSSALKAYEDAFNIKRNLADADDSDYMLQRDLSISHNKIGECHEALGDLDAAVAEFEVAKETSERLSESDVSNLLAQSDLSVCFGNIGRIQFKRNNFQAARSSFEAALAIDEVLAANQDENAETQRSLSYTMIKLGETSTELQENRAAVTWFQRAADLREKILAIDNHNPEAVHDLCVAKTKLGNSLRSDDVAEYDRALEVFNSAVTLCETALVEHESSDRLTSDLVICKFNLANQLEFQQQLPEAITQYKQILEIAETQTRPNTGVVGFALRQLASIYDTTAETRSQAGNIPAAIASLTTANDYKRQLIAAGDTDRVIKLSLWSSEVRIGRCYEQTRELDKAHAQYETAIEMAKELVEEGESDKVAQDNLSLSYTNLGHVQIDQGKLNAALATFELCLAVNEKIADDHPDDADAQREVSYALLRLGEISAQLENHETAISWFQRGCEIRTKLLELDKTNPDRVHDLIVGKTNLGLSQIAISQNEAALETFESAITLCVETLAVHDSFGQMQSDLVMSAGNAGKTHFAQGEWDAAIVNYEQAIKTLEAQSQPFAPGIAQLQNQLQQCEQIAQLIADWEQLTALPEENQLSLLYYRVRELIRASNLEDAKQTLDHWNGLAPDDADQLYNLACGYGIFLTALEQPQDLDEEVLTKFRTECKEQALIALKAAVAAGFNDLAHMSEDADLEALRDEEEFKTLIGNSPSLTQR